MLAGENQPSEMFCRFDYATSSAGTNEGVTSGLAAKWCEDYSPASPIELGIGTEAPTTAQLDYALLRLAKPMGTTHGRNAAGGPRGFIATKRGTAAPADNSVVFVLQHPLGDPMKLAIGVAKGTNANTTRVMHDANTERGSSGSPCLNAKLELVALHNAGDLLYDGMMGAPTQNQAVPLEPILARLERKGAPKFWTPDTKRSMALDPTKHGQQLVDAIVSEFQTIAAFETWISLHILDENVANIVRQNGLFDAAGLRFPPVVRSRRAATRKCCRSSADDPPNGSRVLPNLIFVATLGEVQAAVNTRTGIKPIDPPDDWFVTQRPFANRKRLRDELKVFDQAHQAPKACS